MARFTNGWIKLHRDAHEMFPRDHTTYALYLYLCSTANWREGEKPVLINGAATMLGRGELVTSAGEVHGRLGISRHSFRKSIEKLSKCGLVRQRCAREGTYLTILNYDEICALDRPTRQPPTHSVNAPLNSLLPSVNQVRPPIEELRTKNKEKEDIIDFDIRSSAPISGSKKSFLISYWNSKEGLPVWVSTRRDQEILDLEETKEEGYWKRLVDDVARTDYLCARNGSTFRATLVWVVRNHADIASGKYAKHGISMIKKDTRDWAKIEANFKKQLYGEK